MCDLTESKDIAAITQVKEFGTRTPWISE